MTDLPGVQRSSSLVLRVRRALTLPLVLPLVLASGLLARATPAWAEVVAGSAAPTESANTPAATNPGAVPPSVDLPSRLSLDDALQIFRTHGLDLLIAEASVRSAEGDRTAAGAVINPGFTLGYGRVLNYDPRAAGTCGPSGDGCSANQWTAGLSDNNAIEDLLSGKRKLRVNVAEAALAAAKLQRADAARTLEFQIKQQYAQVVFSLAALDFAHDVQASNTQTVDLNQKRYTSGAIDEGALSRVQTAKLESDQAVDTAEDALRQARIGLAYLLGVRGRLPAFEVDRDGLKYRVPTALAAPQEEQLIQRAFEQRPDLRAAGLQRDRAQAAIALAKRQRFPDIAVSAQYTQTGTSAVALQPPTVSFGLNGQLPLFYQQQGEVRRAEADLDTQTLTRTKLEAQVVADVESSLAAFGLTRRLVERMEAALLERARTARDITKRQFDGGTATLIDYLDAQRTFIAINLEYLQDLNNYWTAVYSLEQAVGTELRR